MDKEREQYTVHINNSQKTSGSDTNFTIQFNNNIISNIDPHASIFVYPQKISIPYSFYNINSTNRTFKVVDHTDTEHTITLDIGSPSSGTLATQIATKLNALLITKPGVTPVEFINFTCTFNSTNDFKFTISWNTVGAVKWFEFSPSAANKLLGFSVLSSTAYNVETATSLTSNMAVDLTPYLTIYLHSNLAKRSYTVINGIMSNSTVFCTVSTKNETFGSNITYENGSDDWRHKLDRNFSQATFKLCDKDGNVLDFQGLIDIELKLEVFKPSQKLPMPNTFK